MSFLSDIKGKTRLRSVAESERRDRSAANTSLAGKDVLEDEAERWEYFFNSGASSWYDDIKEFTFTSTFCSLLPAEAQTIVDHWEQKEALSARYRSSDGDKEECENRTKQLLLDAIEGLSSLSKRLDDAVCAEKALSPASLVFVKLSTRSPKDSRKALACAELQYKERIRVLGSSEGYVSANQRWRILCEETTRSTAVSSGLDALHLLLDSERVYEDLEYALRGPPENWSRDGMSLGGGATLAWNMKLCARAWDPRLRPESEFRGIVWGNKLTCLCQYFHPLYFPELVGKRVQIEADVKTIFKKTKLTDAVHRLGGHCIVDFAWLGPGEVIVVELNPFDGVCLGTFPASTGLFLWDSPSDQAIMKGEAPFEFRLRENPLTDAALKAQCNPSWREIIYS